MIVDAAGMRVLLRWLARMTRPGAGVAPRSAMWLLCSARARCPPPTPFHAALVPRGYVSVRVGDLDTAIDSVFVFYIHLYKCI